MATGRGDDERDVRELEDGVGGRLEPHQPRRPGGELALDAIVILDRQHRVRDAEAAERAGDQPARRAVGLREAQHVLALPEQRDQRRGDGGEAGAHRHAVLPPLQLREQQLERVHGRVRAATVVVALVPPGPCPLGRGEVLELELDALVDRLHERCIAGRQRGDGRVVGAGAGFHGSALRRNSGRSFAYSAARRSAAATRVASSLAKHSRTIRSAGEACEQKGDTGMLATPGSRISCSVNSVSRRSEIAE